MTMSSFSGSGLIGSVPGHAVISDTPTGTYTSGSASYSYWTLTASGSLNVTTAGLADVLVVGAGGGGGGGGGADDLPPHIAKSSSGNRTLYFRNPSSRIVS